MRFFNSGKAHIHYAEIGEGTPFVFLHGLGGDIHQILNIYRPPPGIRLITLDFRGHGKTVTKTNVEYRFNAFADDVLDLIEFLNLDKVILGGISMGAGVAGNCAIRYPEKVLGLILSRPAWLDGPMDSDNRERFKMVAELLQNYPRETGRQRLMASHLYLGLGASGKSFLNYFDYDYAQQTADKYIDMPADSPIGGGESWNRIRVPTLIMANKCDPIHPFELGLTYASLIENSEFKEITPKAVSEQEHTAETQFNIDLFVQRLSATIKQM